LSISIRKAKLRDLDEIYKIELECFTHDAFSRRLFEYFLKSSDFITLMAFLDEQPAGFITVSFDYLQGKPTAHIYTINVKQDCRRIGVGSSLLTFLERTMTEKNIEACYLEVHADNIAAKNLYVKNGYKPIKTLKDYYGFGADGIKYRKKLKISK